VADERLRRWAAERVPELLARAEEEALAEARTLLRDTLVEAALEHGEASAPGAGRRDAPREPPQREPPPGERRQPPSQRAAEPSGEAQWLYAVGPGGAGADPVSITGVADAPVHTVKEGGLTALVSPVPLPEFGGEMLKESLNDLGWLEEVARAHQRVVDDAFERGPVVPLRLCTIYESDDRVRTLLREDGDRFARLIQSIEGREEWSVKLYVDPERLETEAVAHCGETMPDPGLGAGGAYLAKRKTDRFTREEGDRLAGAIAEEVHARLQDWASDAVVGRPQNPELSGHSGQMLLNGAYLVESEGSERFGQLVDELQGRYSELGARLEISGPWPPYNFIASDP